MEVQQKLQQQVVRYSNPGQGLPSPTGHWSSCCRLETLGRTLGLPELWVCDAESLLSDPAALRAELGPSTLLLEQLSTSVCVTHSDTAAVQAFDFFGVYLGPT